MGIGSRTSIGSFVVKMKRDTDSHRPDSRETRCHHGNPTVPSVVQGYALKTCWLRGARINARPTGDAESGITTYAALMIAFPTLATSATKLTTTTVVTTAPPTAYVQVFEANAVFYSSIFSFLAGSIVNVDTVEDRTTIGANCIHSLVVNCSLETVSFPPTFTMGPSTYIHSSSGSEQNSQQYTSNIDSRACRIFSSTQSASCEIFASYWYSDAQTSTSKHTKRHTTLRSSEINYHNLLITAGIEKLPTAVTTSQTQKRTATVPTATALASTTAAASSPSPNSQSHPSKAWVAGPVVGAVVGCGLIAAVLYWCLRRKRQKVPSADSGPIIQDPSEEIRGLDNPVKSAYKACTPAETQGTPVSELPADEPSCIQHTA
ncbi:uncharacterized protein BO88DRAFT_428081 [Aspergillus vadensis CBS 113365]|uniref:Mid2 domain-containing protein n=1 Tax=Aspergillus vadensis (strain CBS 113365 / IMI 142717 / IBT 24658) TaxID=1448311 RepID=A0A319B1R2_ASPVC|nr:hypothetical protein BO88DRAFT_428081 [Aspergillus vadensis CBS 113365]PYH66145.1 hypothetical protein BO88DRAFT_428081 [Aspergillus vadensis CBS 113365]